MLCVNCMTKLAFSEFLYIVRLAWVRENDEDTLEKCKFLLTIMKVKDIFSYVWVTELSSSWKRVANSACHLFFLWLSKNVCLSLSC